LAQRCRRGRDRLVEARQLFGLGREGDAEAEEQGTDGATQKHAESLGGTGGRLGSWSAALLLPFRQIWQLAASGEPIRVWPGTDEPLRCGRRGSRATISINWIRRVEDDTEAFWDPCRTRPCSGARHATRSCRGRCCCRRKD